jgi:hypothetical protein
MRVPKAGQDLIERRIVREGKQLAKAMMADYSDPSAISLSRLVSRLSAWRNHALAMLGGRSLGH